MMRPGGMNRLLGYALGAFAIVLAGAAVLWLRGGYSPPSIPAVPADGLDHSLTGALRAARGRVAASPRSAQAWGVLGMLFQVHGHRAEAVICLEAARRLEPGTARWWYLGGVCVWKTEPAEALGLMRRAIALGSAEPRAVAAARLSVLHILFALNETDEAETEIGRARAGGEPEGPLRFFVGVLAMRRGRWGEARAHLEPMANDPACRKVASTHLAVIYHRLGLAEKAEAMSRRASQLADDEGWEDPWADEMRAFEVGTRARQSELLAANDHKDPQETLRALLRLDREAGGMDYSITFSLARVYTKLRRQEEAEAAYRRALALGPDRFRPHVAFAIFQLSRGADLADAGKPEAARPYYEEAVALLQKGRNLAPLDVVGAYQHGLALMLLGRNEEALGPLREAASGRPEEGPFHMALAETLARLGRREEALAEFDAAARLAPPDDTRAADKRAAWTAKWAGGKER